MMPIRPDSDPEHWNCNLLASIKNAQAAEEAFIPQKRTSGMSKHEIYLLFSFGSFFLSWIRIQQPKLKRIYADPDSKPWTLPRPSHWYQTQANPNWLYRTFKSICGIYFLRIVSVEKHSSYPRDFPLRPSLQASRPPPPAQQYPSVSICTKPKRSVGTIKKNLWKNHTTNIVRPKQCSGSGSTCFWASRIRIHFLLASWRSMAKLEGSGSISQRRGSADPDLDPHQNVMEPKHWNEHWSNCRPVSTNTAIIKDYVRNVDDWIARLPAARYQGSSQFDFRSGTLDLGGLPPELQRKDSALQVKSKSNTNIRYTGTVPCAKNPTKIYNKKDRYYRGPWPGSSLY